MQFSEIMNSLMEEEGISNIQLGKEIGVSDVMIGQWRKGKSSPSLDKAVKIAEYFGVSLDMLSGVSSHTERMVRLPLIGAVNAGAFTIESEDEWKGEYRPVSVKALHGRNKKECVLLEVSGDSMEPMIHKGELLVVHRQPIAVNGNIVVAYDADQGGYTIKRFAQHGDSVSLEPANTNYKTIRYINPDVQQLQIYGICLNGERSML